MIIAQRRKSSKMRPAAVLTADIVRSTSLSAALERQLVARLRLILSSTRFEFYRGDSFQAYTRQAADALLLSLRCRCAAISLNRVNREPGPDIRIGLGIGNVKIAVTSPGLAKGEAFLLSGRIFETLADTGRRLAISTHDPLACEGLQVIAAYTDTIFNSLTPKQAGVIGALLNGSSQQAVALALRKSKSTVSQHAAAAHWPEIQDLIIHFQKIIKLMS